MKEKITTSEPIIACDGGKEGHPRVFLHFGDEKEIECPYCGRTFVLDPSSSTKSHH